MHYFDLGSTNGSAVNGQAAEHQVLGNDDVIAVGDVRIIFSLKDAADGGDVDLDATDTFEIFSEDAPTWISHSGNAARKPGKP